MIRAVFMCVLSLASVAKADMPKFSMGETDTCLAQGKDVDLCVGASAQACWKADENAGGRGVVSACLTQEQQEWQRRAFGSFHDVMEMAGGADAGLQKAQDSWLNYRRDHCDFAVQHWNGRPEGALELMSCLMRQDAKRVIELRPWLVE